MGQCGWCCEAEKTRRKLTQHNRKVDDEENEVDKIALPLENGGRHCGRVLDVVGG